MKPILLIGGHGVAGNRTALQLRSSFPDLPLAIAGRNFEAVSECAERLGNAEAYRVDLDGNDPHLGLPHADFSAMAVFLMDESFGAMAFAGQHAIPYLCVTGGAFETGLQFTHALHAARSVPVILAPHWFCGAAMMMVLHLGQAFSKVTRADLAILIDRNGSKSGPATKADFNRITASCHSALDRTAGRYSWISGEEGARTYSGLGGAAAEGVVSVSIDAASIGAACGAAEVHVLETWGDSASFLAGEAASDEIIVELAGVGIDGTPTRLRREIIASREAAPLTPIFAALLIEHAAGLAFRSALAAGVYTPELVVTPSDAVRRLTERGVGFGSVRPLQPE